MEQGCFGEGFHDAAHVVDVHQSFYSLYIYCDLVQPQIVGGSLVPLLRIVPTMGTMGQMITNTYENVHYHLMRRKHFNTMEIDI